ncbi:uncharacterized protein BX663DRAFT_495692 [Cokeromyces recurvatus]|uniref:uncharacterized protein n=1 Tax=Cokeromyces recurvatus TaxID=90255 RepID=UPI00222008F5|nr:uncharacterized protein BX663DRAFT_495692 [Cokeromyces recurvatus]KAI7907371.1 hypothetical protein BX663DRAFT_495692 [Cokeromyces recurvatus]
MPIIKATYPDLNELSKVVGPIDGIDSNKNAPPLCENIFDVQRNELFNVLERLRTVFWSDEIITPTSDTTSSMETTMATTPILEQNVEHKEEEEDLSIASTHSLKRARLESNEEDTNYLSDAESTLHINGKKRARLQSLKQVETAKLHKLTETKTSKQNAHLTSSFYSFMSLWPLKLSLVRQIKTAHYNESNFIATFADMYETKSREQCQHVIIYLIPIAKAMRRENLVNFLTDKLSSM